MFRRRPTRAQRSRRAKSAPRKPQRYRKFSVELLEDRRMMAVLTVNSGLDNTTPADGLVTLREAIIAANGHTTTDLGETGANGLDMIQFAPSVYAGGIASIFLNGGEMAITETLTINGPGFDKVELNAHEASRHFNILGAAGDVTINGLAFIRGKTTVDDDPTTGDDGDSGGSIHSVSGGTLTINNCVFANNHTEGKFAAGGAIYSRNSVVMTSCDIRDNSTEDAGANGGAIAVGQIASGFGNLTMTNCTVNNNHTADNAANGGGVSCEGTATLVGSTLSNNHADDSHGGGFSGRTLILINSTVSGNFTDEDDFGDGGGINAATFTSISSTITNNQARGEDNDGGGVFVFDGNSDIVDTIIFGNSADGYDDLRIGAAPGSTASIRFSMIGDPGNTGLVPSPNPDANGNLVGVNPMLGPLANNGGSPRPDFPTFTHLPAPTSPAVDAGDPGATIGVNNLPATDQRGVPFGRIYAFNGGGPRIDIGAVELPPPPDALEFNDTRATATFLGSDPFVTLRDLSISPAGDQDFFRYIAHESGKLIVRTFFNNAAGDLDLEIQGASGNVIFVSQGHVDEELAIIPVVAQQTYFIRVYGNTNTEVNSYSLEVENFPAPVPAFVDLTSASDTGMMSDDNITRDTTPTFRIQADLTDFSNMGIALLNQSGIDPNNDGDPTDSTLSGAGVFVTLVNQETGAAISGFANRVGTSTTLWAFTVSTPLPDGEYFVSAAVQIVDFQQPQRANGRAQLSDPLTIVIQSEAPLNVETSMELLASSDSGMFDDDHVTNKMQPAFSGLGPVNAKVYVFAQKTNATTGLPIGNPLLVGNGVVSNNEFDGEPFDDEPAEEGVWEVTVEPLADGKYNFWAIFETLSGAVSGPVALSATKMNATAQAIPDPGTITSTIAFAAGDFPTTGTVPMTNLPVIDVNVTVNISHGFDADLDIFLISPPTAANPTGIRIALSRDNGGSGDNYTGTVFDDAAGTSITAGVAPFSGRFRPEEPLSDLMNENAIGTWTLEVTDDEAVVAGRFLSWSLEIVTPVMVVIDTEAPNTPYLDLLDDTGRHDNDNITKTNKPSFSMTTTDPNVAFSQLLFTDNFKFRVFDRFEGSQEVLIYDSATDALADANLTASDMFTALTLLTRNLPTNGVFADGVHNLKLEVEDRAGNISHDFLFELVVDTVTPPVSFGLPEDASEEDGLAASSDTGVVTVPDTFADRVTSDTTPTLWGRAEANSIVRVYLDRNLNEVIDLATDTFLGQTVATPFDGNDAFPDGYWELTVALDLNQIVGLPKDGLRQLLVTAQDVAGNPMAMEGVISEGDGDAGIDELQIFIDTQGPQITGITVNNLTSAQYDLFDLKPTQQGPTPAVTSLKIALRDLPSRIDQDEDINDFLYEALVADIASTLGNYRLVGDFNGVIPIDSVAVTTFAPGQINGTLSAVGSTSSLTAAGLVGLATPPEVGDYILMTDGPAAGQARRIVAYNAGTGQMTLDIPLLNLPVVGNSFTITTFATATVELKFAEPLPDDRYTLTVSDNLVDPANNHLDGESNPIEPIEFPTFPTGDGVPGGSFVARFTIDSRPEIGVWAAGAVKIDTNGNFYFDPQAIDAHNRDLAYTLGFSSDYVFAGNFAHVGGVADGFDKLAVYGRVGSQWRWLIDFSNDGIPDAAFNEAAINGIPVAGNFDGNKANGDEVGIFTGSTWHFDRNHNFSVDTSFSSAYQGFPVVGDFDGDGDDDVATYIASKTGGNFFNIDRNTAGAGNPISIDGVADFSFRVGLTGFASAGGSFGFPGVRERPVAADMNADGVDDLGLWVPDGTTLVPGDEGEWYFLLSNNSLSTPAVIENSIVDRAAAANGFISFNITPFGRDLYARFGNSFALPIVGNFDPPITSAQAAAASNPATVTTAAATSTNPTPTAAATVVAAPIVTAPVTTPTVAATAPTVSTSTVSTPTSTATTVAKAAATVTNSAVVPTVSTTITKSAKKSSPKSSPQTSSAVVVTKTTPAPTPTPPVVAATVAPVVVSVVTPSPVVSAVGLATVAKPVVNQATTTPAVVATTTTTKAKSSKGTTNKTVTTTAITRTVAATSTASSKPAVTTTAQIVIAPVAVAAKTQTVTVAAPSPIAVVALAAPKVVAAKSPVVENSVIVVQSQQPLTTAKLQANPSVVSAKVAPSVAATVARPLAVSKSVPLSARAAQKVVGPASEGGVSSTPSTPLSGVFQVSKSGDLVSATFAGGAALQDPATADAAVADLRLTLLHVEDQWASAKATTDGCTEFDAWQEADPVADEVASALASDLVSLGVK